LSGDIGGVVIGGRLAGSEKPLLLSLLCKSNGEAKVVMDWGFFTVLPSISGSFESFGILIVPNSPLSAISMLFGVCEPSFGNKTEMGSLAGAAYLLNINAGVLRRAQ